MNLDDCYIEPGSGGRNATTHVLQPDAVKFGGTAGMKALSAYVRTAAAQHRARSIPAHSFTHARTHAHALDWRREKVYLE